MHYISGIISGLYSLGGQDDKVLIECKFGVVPIFENIAHRGMSGLSCTEGFPLCGWSGYPRENRMAGRTSTTGL
jgi:hypothetical protein